MQIESPAAVEACEEIAALDGVDVLFIGPGDLSHAMGIRGQLRDPRFRSAVERVVAAAEGAGRAAGILAPGPEPSRPPPPTASASSASARTRARWRAPGGRSPAPDQTKENRREHPRSHRRRADLMGRLRGPRLGRADAGRARARRDARARPARHRGRPRRLSRRRPERRRRAGAPLWAPAGRRLRPDRPAQARGARAGRARRRAVRRRGGRRPRGRRGHRRRGIRRPPAALRRRVGDAARGA